MRRDTRRPCALCGIGSRNATGIRVFAYTLLRRVYEPGQPKRTTSFGTIPLCDRCVQENGRGAAGRRHGFSPTEDVAV